ncbi:uncharacterized protein LOC136039399 [Artemia franciscana]|uniref:Uncharacterized protein n=1 Tax=Artemia franciscana TaxID=6661 RepID=A0AA88HXL2_ARTSF|nr:hypothetical protein QYM36_007208 [Artemia franciscana]KAK2716987.1 hypothetical protein QYM36_007208 [Artemia franciscana]KAK2716988.1 hypothetical protein QYM36_007208 [Artemia franciscana]
MLSAGLQYSAPAEFQPTKLFGGVLWEEPNQPYIFCTTIHRASLSGGGLIEKSDDAQFRRMPSLEPWCQEEALSGMSNSKKRSSFPILNQSFTGNDRVKDSNMVCGIANRLMNRNESTTLLFTGDYNRAQSFCAEKVCDCLASKRCACERFDSLRSENQSFLFDHIISVFQQLRLSGWYYEGLSAQESVQLLSSAEVGSFLIRDSSDSRYLFSLSLHTKRGPTSVRIHYKNGRFSLDSDRVTKNEVPSFSSVHNLVSYYAEEGNRNKNGRQVWLDGDGQVFGNIHLKKPVLKSVQNLKHLCRLAWNKCSLKQQIFLAEQSGVPSTILSYLSSYPHMI